MSIRFGLQLHGSLPIDAYPRLAARAEQLGFADVTVHDVLMRRPVWPLLCDVARATTHVRIAPNVTHPYLQHPALIASNIAHLDELSDGRASVGIGRGSMYEFVQQRMPAGFTGLEEAVRVIRALLSGADETFSGSVFGLGPHPGLLFGRRRAVPISLGVYGKRGVELAGRVADGVRSAGQWDPAYAIEIRQWLDDATAAAGREANDVELVVENWTCIHPDRDRARNAARQILASFLPHLGSMLGFYQIPEREVDAARAASTGGDVSALIEISDVTIDRFMAAGDSEDLARGLDRLVDAGFSAISFSGLLGPEPEAALELIGDEIARRSRLEGSVNRQ